MLLYLYKDRIRNVKNKTTNANACSVCECLLHLLADVVLEDDGHDGDEGERGEQRNWLEREDAAGAGERV